MNNKNRHYLLLFIKYSLLAGVIYYIILSFNSHKKEDIHSVFSVQLLQSSNVVYLLLALLLVPINWYFEMLKYSSLFKGSRIYTTVERYKIILAGVSFALITPMKLGDYAGRLVMTDRPDRRHSLWASFLGNWCQWVILGVFGLAGFQLMLNYIQLFTPQKLLLVNVLLLLVIVLLIYFLFKKLSWMGILLKIIPKKFYRYFKNYQFETYVKHRRSIMKACMFAAFRYWVYVVQFVLILKFYGAGLSFFTCITAVCTIYFIQLMLPFLSWLGLIGRTGIAIFVLSSLGISEMISGVATLLLWIINMLVPSVFGIYFIIRFRRTKLKTQ